MNYENEQIIKEIICQTIQGKKYKKIKQGPKMLSFGDSKHGVRPVVQDNQPLR